MEFELRIAQGKEKLARAGQYRGDFALASPQKCDSPRSPQSLLSVSDFSFMIIVLYIYKEFCIL